MNRAEMMRRWLAHKLAAAACEKALKGEAQRAFDEQGSADTWRMPGAGTLSVSLAHDRASVTDDAAFMEWFAKRYPTEVVTVTRVEVRNPEWVKTMLAGLEAVDPDELEPGDATMVCDPEGGEIVPGVEWRKGGRFLSASIRPDSDLERRMKKAAEAYVNSGEPMPGLAPPAPPRPAAGEATSGPDDAGEIRPAA